MSILINEERLDRIIEGVILEKLGVSDEVLSISNRIRSQALELLNSDRYQLLDDWRKHCVELGIKQMFPNGIEQIPSNDIDLRSFKFLFMVEGIGDLEYMIDHVMVCAYGYNMLDVENENYAVGFLSEYLGSHGENFCYFVPDGRYIVLNIPCGIDPRDYSVHIGKTILSVINHEVKHAFQCYKSGGNNNTRDKFYNISNTHGNTEAESKMIAHLGLNARQIKYAYYALDFGEVDSVLQQIYVDMTEKGCELQRSWSYLDFMEARNIFNRIYEFYTTRKYSFGIRFIFRMIYGADVLDRYIRHCQRGIKRFDEHLRRIIGRVSSEHPEQKLF